MDETHRTDEAKHGIGRRDVLRSAAAVGAIGAVGIPAFSVGAAAGSTKTKTVVSDATTQVVGYRAGTGQDEPADCTLTDPDTPADPTWEHPNWSSVTSQFSASADWIWHCDENNSAGNGEYHVKEPIYGDVVEFERTFTIDGDPTTGSIDITADNGYELWVNGTYIGGAQVHGDWECSDLSESHVNSSGWQSVETHDISSALECGENTLTILAANELMQSGVDGQSDGTVTSNPGGVIYEAEIEYACTDCTDGDALLVKYEWDDDTGAFVVEGDPDPNIELGSVTLDEDGEPSEACFDVDYCDVDVVVKAANEYELYEDASCGVCVTGIRKHAISNVRFFCDAPDELGVGRSR